MRASKHPPRQWRATQARWRAMRAAVRKVRLPLAVLSVTVVIATLAFWLGGAQKGLGRSLLYVIGLITLQSTPGDLPEHPLLGLFAFAVMAIGLAAIAGGAARLFQLAGDPREQQVALASTFSDHVIVCGVGKVGLRVIEHLLDSEQVVAIDVEERAEWTELLQKRGVPVVVGDARREQVLRDAGVERASAILACTEHDLTNLDIALSAREIHSEIRVVMRMFDTLLASKVSRAFDIDVVESVSALAAPFFAVAAIHSNVKFGARSGGQLLNICTINFREGSPFIGRKVAETEKSVGCAFVGRETHAGVRLELDRAHVISTGAAYAVVGSLPAIRELSK